MKDLLENKMFKIFIGAIILVILIIIMLILTPLDSLLLLK